MEVAVGVKILKSIKDKLGMLYLLFDRLSFLYVWRRESENYLGTREFS